MDQNSDNIARLKRAARDRARQIRAAIAPDTAARAALALADLVMRSGLAGRGPVAGYWPLRDEMDPRPLMRHLAATGIDTCLPAMTGRGRPLEFRRWREGDPLVPGAFGVMEPVPEADMVRPALVLAPMLAFDRAGRRLGYGAGFYDRTLAALRAARSPVTVLGVGHAAQEMDVVPVDGYDQPLDAVATERELILFRSGLEKG